MKCFEMIILYNVCISDGMLLAMFKNNYTFAG